MKSHAVEDGHAVLEAAIKYVPRGVRAVFYPTDRSKSSWPVDERRLAIHDMRPLVDTLRLERNGFLLLQEPTALCDVEDPGEIKRVYYPEVARLIERLTGASRVLVFGEVARSDRSGTPDGRLPSWGAHVDYDEGTVRDLAQRLLGPAEAPLLCAQRMRLINLWRPTRLVERTPLALCDASTVTADELNPSEIRGGLNDPDRPALFGFNLSYSPRHRWYYAPRMRPDEVLAFKLFDSERDRVQWTAHTAFEDPSAPVDAAPRESLEIRTIAFGGR